MKLTLMTINLRYGTANDDEHVWENRRPIMMEMLRKYSPDIFGVQEGLRFQLDEIIEALPGYACFGEGREGLDKPAWLGNMQKRSIHETNTHDH